MKWQAREAIKNGRPEEAHRLLDSLIASGNRRAWALRSDVVRGYVERAEKFLAQNSPEAAWQDLAKVESIAPGDKAGLKLREKLIQFELTGIRQSLENGKPLEALRLIGHLREQPIQSNELTLLEAASQEWALAEDYAQRGDFPQAKQAVENCRQKLGKVPAGLEKFERELDRREDRFRESFSKLQESANQLNAREVLKHADDALAVAPMHRDVQTLRSRAWTAVQPETPTYRSDPTSSEGSPLFSSASNAFPLEPLAPVKRFYLWIDGIGGFLVCMGQQVTIGQASLESGPVDIPLMADVSRFHASLKRDDENYILESSQQVQINGKCIERAGVLQVGDLLTLNASCNIRFNLPVPGCASARLDFPGSRRLPMAVDAVLLMADLLVLGPGEKVHVCLPDLEQPLRIFRQKDRVGIQWAGEYYIEGQKQTGRALIPTQGSIYSPQFTMAVEPVKNR